MSKTTIALEEAVTAALSKMTDGRSPATPRQRLELDRAFVRITALLAPRIRHFIRQYGLAGHWDDAEQACAIAVHRALQTYDREKAQFTTFVNWSIRGELQALRFRLMTDQRSSARKAAAITVSLNALVRPEGQDGAAVELAIEDEHALPRTEAGASQYLAESAMHTLLDSYVAHLRGVGIGKLSRRAPPRRKQAVAPNDRPRLKVNAIDADELRALEERIGRNRALIESRLFALSPVEEDGDPSITKERMRQIVKRAARTMVVLTQSNPQFTIMASDGAPSSPSGVGIAPRVRSHPPVRPARPVQPDCNVPTIH